MTRFRCYGRAEARAHANDSDHTKKQQCCKAFRKSAAESKTVDRTKRMPSAFHAHSRRGVTPRKREAESSTGSSNTRMRE
eukprot:690586-Pyramimonas_sp.AAC.2